MSIKAFFKWAIGAALIALLLAFVDWRETLVLLINVRAVPIALAIVTGILGILVSVAKWRILLAAQAVELPWFPLVSYYWTGTFFSNFLPTSVGGDVVRLVAMRQHGQSAQIGSSIVAERLSGVMVLVLLCALGLLMRQEYFRATGVYLVLWAAVIGAATAIVVCVQFGRRLLAYSSTRLAISGAWQLKLSEILRKITESFDLYSKRLLSLSFAFLISFPFYFLVMLSQFLVIQAFEVDLRFEEVVYIAPMIALVSMIPLSPNAVGVAEGAFVLFYTQAGLTVEQAFAAAIVRRAVNLLVSSIGGVFWALQSSETR